ncbi:hypothetical protein ACLB2K_044822 [Fragaria x ananassa]
MFFLFRCVLEKIVDACDRALALDSAKKKVLEFVQSRMGFIAPNLSAIVGSAVAAKLMGMAGGLAALAKMPACNVQLPALRMRSGRLLAAKSTLAARVDSTRADPSGNTGKALREEIQNKIEKWQEPPPEKQPKPLPVPDSEPKKKRGGRRLRKRKERYATSRHEEARKQGWEWQVTPVKVAKKFKNKNYGSAGGAISGLTSSLAFTPVQGIELSNPQAHGQ